MVEDHLDALYGMARAWSRTEDQARDIVQQTFLKAFEKRNQLKDPASARSWLITILRNELRGEFRTLARQETWDPQAFESIPEQDPTSWPDPEMVELLPVLLANLPNGSRQVMELRFQQELSYEGIAALLDIPIGTVMSRLHRAKAILRFQLDEALPRSMDAT